MCYYIVSSFSIKLQPKEITMKLTCNKVATISPSKNNISMISLQEAHGEVYWEYDGWECANQVLCRGHASASEKDNLHKKEETLVIDDRCAQVTYFPWVRKKDWKDAHSFMKAVISFHGKKIESEWEIYPFSNRNIYWSIPEDVAIEGIRLFEEGPVSNIAILFEDEIFLSGIEWMQEEHLVKRKVKTYPLNLVSKKEWDAMWK